MASDESWKGEHLIRGLRMERSQRYSEDKRVLNVMYHKKRRKKGEPTAAATNHQFFVRSALFWKKREPSA